MISLNSENAKKMLPIVTALAEGKHVVYGGHRFISVALSTFLEHPEQYTVEDVIDWTKPVRYRGKDKDTSSIEVLYVGEEQVMCRNINGEFLANLDGRAPINGSIMYDIINVPVKKRKVCIIRGAPHHTLTVASMSADQLPTTVELVAEVEIEE